MDIDVSNHALTDKFLAHKVAHQFDTLVLGDVLCGAIKTSRGRKGKAHSKRELPARRSAVIPHRQRLRQESLAIQVALSRLMAARQRHQAARARAAMRDWEVQRRERTKHQIELGGLVVKASIVDLTDDDCPMIYGALLTVAECLRAEDRDRVLELWKCKGRRAFECNTNRDGA